MRRRPRYDRRTEVALPILVFPALALAVALWAPVTAEPTESTPETPSAGDTESEPDAPDDSAEPTDEADPAVTDAAPTATDADPTATEEDPTATEEDPAVPDAPTSDDADAGPDGNELDEPTSDTESEPAEPDPSGDGDDPAPASVSTTGSDGKRKRKGLARHRFVYTNLTAVRYNPLGLLNELTIGYRLQLIDKNTTLFKESFLKLNFHGYVTPAFGRVGPSIQFQPLAILNLTATYDGIGYFGSFDLAQGFPSPRSDYSDTAIEQRGQDGLNTATRGRLVTLSALLQAKVGRVAVRDNAKGYYLDLDLRTDPTTGRQDTVSYSQTLDILMPNAGWAMTNDADLLYLFDWGLTLGARYTLTKAFFRDSDFLPGESTDDPIGLTHRVGPAVLYTPKKWAAKAAERHNHSRKRWRKPTAILLLQWWAKNPNRSGSDVSAGVPYLVLGFRFQGDLTP